MGETGICRDLATPVIVYKVGGSLLNLPDLRERLEGFLAEGGRARRLLVAGGGGAAELVREWDRVHGLGEERAHWLALEGMRLSERLLETLLPRAVRVASRKEADVAWRDDRWPVVAASAFLQDEEPRHATMLPHSWEATSDSVAAWVAACWPADALVLLKSVDLPEGASFRAAAEAGLVDACFPRLAEQLPAVRWVNLRGVRPTESVWAGRHPAASR